MSILKLILAVMVAVTPAGMRPKDDSAKMGTYETIAQDINAAVDDPIYGLPFDGPAAKEASAIALATITRHESGFSEKVRSCEKKGDGGHSISLVQLIDGPGRRGRTEEEICSNPVLAQQLGLGVLMWYRNVPTTLAMFQGYAAGHAGVKSDAANFMDSVFKRQLRDNHIQVIKYPGAKVFSAEWIKEPMVLSANGPS